MVFLIAMRETLPFTYPESIRILGVKFDQRICFMEHVTNVLGWANTRLVRSTWALEPGVLRKTHLALLTSLTNIGLVIYRSGAYEKTLRRLRTLHANVTARRITGISRLA